MRIQLDPCAFPPVRDNATAGGLEFRVPNCIKLNPAEPMEVYDSNMGRSRMVVGMSSMAVDTGVHMDIPEGYVGLIRPLPELCTRYGLVANGTVNPGDRSSVEVMLHLLGKEKVQLLRGEHFAQLILVPCALVDLEIVDRFTDMVR